VARHFAGASSGEAKLALLQQLSRVRPATAILEIGTAYGLSAIAMALAPERPRVTTIDFFEPQASIGPANIKSIGLSNVECVTENKLAALPRLAGEGRHFDFVFHDGGHAGDWYISDFETIVPMLEPHSIYVIDDITWDSRPHMRELTKSHSKRTCFEGWQELLKDPRVEGAVVANHSIGILLLR
jgi:predicted O-methyltransferase YrrM